MHDLVDDETKQQPPLLFLQVPFAGDVKDMPDFVDMEQREAANEIQKDGANDKDKNIKAAKSLIQSLMLNLADEHVQVLPENPYNMALNRTLLERAMDPKAPCVQSHVVPSELQTPPQLLKEAKPALQTFRETFPVKSSVKLEKPASSTKKGRNKVVTHMDFL